MADPDRLAADRLTAERGIRIGAVPGVTLTKWTRIWTERFPRIRLHVTDLAESEARRALDDDVIDMCFVRLPVPDDNLHLIPLYEEVPVVVVPQDHPVSLFEEVSLADLADETVLDPTDTADAIDLVAGGAGVMMVPHSIARSHSRRDLVYRPISDGTPTRIALVWRVDNPSELIEEFIGIVRGRTPNSSRAQRVQAPDKGGPPKNKAQPRPRAARPKRRSR
ncbi:MAG: LysR family transcriptional regulator substrate-binding protein [Propionibacteriaceae bacterium]